LPHRVAPLSRWAKKIHAGNGKCFISASGTNLQSAEVISWDGYRDNAGARARDKPLSSSRPGEASRARRQSSPAFIQFISRACPSGLTRTRLCIYMREGAPEICSRLRAQARSRPSSHSLPCGGLVSHAFMRPRRGEGGKMTTLRFVDFW
jgi:hypothetical protein